MIMNLDEEVFLLHQLVLADPGADRDGEWRDGVPVMGWMPKLGAISVTDPNSGRGLFANRDDAVSAARCFQTKSIERLLELDELLPDGWLWVHLKIGNNIDHLATSKCWCNPVKVGPDDAVPEGGFIVS